MRRHGTHTLGVMTSPSLVRPTPLTDRLSVGRHDYHRFDANRHGVAPATLASWVRQGHLEALGGGDYVIVDDLPEGPAWVQRREAHLRRCSSILAGHPGAYLVGRSSVAARGLPLLSEPSRVEVSARPRLTSQRASIRAYMPWSDEPEVVAGRPCQPIAESITQISAQHGPRAGLVSADAALHSEVASGEMLRRAVERFGSRRGVSAARLVAEMADGRIESPGESLVRWQAWESGVELVPQVTIRESDGAFVARVDFVIAGTRVIVEFDGLGKYATAADLRAEKLRQVRLERLGYVVVRFTFADLRTPGLVARVLGEHAVAA